MYFFGKKNSKIFYPEGPRENVFLGPAVALDGPAMKTNKLRKAAKI